MIEGLLWPADIVAQEYPHHVYLDRRLDRVMAMQNWCERHTPYWNYFRVDEKYIFMFLEEGVAVHFALRWS